jgi:hypothetical protein
MSRKKLHIQSGERGEMRARDIKLGRLDGPLEVLLGRLNLSFCDLVGPQRKMDAHETAGNAPAQGHHSAMCEYVG